MFLLAPQAARGGWGRSRLAYGTVLGVIRDALARFPIDPDRVHLDGASMGGNGSFHFAAHHPDVLAAVAPRIGGPEFTHDPKTKKVTAHFLENLRNVPVHWVVGARDEKVPINWVRAASAHGGAEARPDVPRGDGRGQRRREGEAQGGALGAHAAGERAARRCSTPRR